MWYYLLHAVALSGRKLPSFLTTQGVALGYVVVGFQPDNVYSKYRYNKLDSLISNHHMTGKEIKI